jgi:DNA-binding HxlR family transcriptional regulator
MKDCPVKYALDVLSGKWTMYIMAPSNYSLFAA